MKTFWKKIFGSKKGGPDAGVLVGHHAKRIVLEADLLGRSPMVLARCGFNVSLWPEIFIKRRGGEVIVETWERFFIEREVSGEKYLELYYGKMMEKVGGGSAQKVVDFAAAIENFEVDMELVPWYPGEFNRWYIFIGRAAFDSVKN